MTYTVESVINCKACGGGHLGVWFLPTGQRINRLDRCYGRCPITGRQIYRLVDLRSAVVAS